MATVFVILKTRVPVHVPQPATKASTELSPQPDLPVPEFNHIILAINANLRTALKVDNDVFRKAILNDASAFRAMTSNWAQHQIDAAGKNYNSVLIQLYSNAQKSVFCTSMPDYLSTWKDEPLGDLLIEAHGRSEAHVTRVFIFDKRVEVTDEAVNAMQKLSQSIPEDKMSVRVWIDEEDPAFDFPPLLSRDFTIIDDGAAIGITLKLERDDFSARWFFESEEYTPICRNVADNIKRGSVSFSDFSLDWRKRKRKG